MRLSHSFAFLALSIASMGIAGCDLVEPADDSPPTSMTGSWSTGQVNVRFDSSFAVEGDPTYASVQIGAVFHVETDMGLTDTGGDIRGQVHDVLYAETETRYVRHDGVVVTDVFTDDRLGSAHSGLEAVYVAPTMTVTSVASYMEEFVDLRLDFSDGEATFTRRLRLPITLRRLGNRRVVLTRTADTTLRRPAVN